MNKICVILITIGIIFLSKIAGASANVIIIGNPANKNTLDENQVTNIFLGKTREFPDGQIAKSIDQAEGSKARLEFYEKVIKKDETALKTYWSTLIFTGKASPPNALADDAAVKKFVAATPNAIGYIDSKSLDSSVKALLISK